MLSFIQKRILCPRHGDMLVEITRDGVREHPCCATCEPERYMKLLKEATQIELITENQPQRNA